MKKLLIYSLAIVIFLMPISFSFAQETGLPNPNSSGDWIYYDGVISKEIDGNDYKFNIPGGGGGTNIYSPNGETILNRGVTFFALEKFGDVDFTKIPQIYLIIENGGDSNQYGEIIFIGYQDEDSTSPRNIIIKDSSDEEGRKLTPFHLNLLGKIEKERPEALVLYRYLNSIISFTSYKQNISDNYVKETFTGTPLPDKMLDACSSKLPEGIVDLSNPPTEVKNAFSQWNEQFDDEDLNVPVINNEVNEINQDLYKMIIPTDHSYLVLTDERASAVSTQLNQLETEINNMWTRDDEEATFSTQIKSCITGVIGGAIIGSIIPVGSTISGGIAVGSTISGGIAGGATCLAGSYGANKLADLLYGTKVPKYYTTNVLAIYYDTKYLSYLKCLKDHDDFENLPIEMKEKIISEISKIEGQIRALEQEGNDAKDQSESGKYLKSLTKQLAQWLEEMFIKIFEVIGKLFEKVPV